MSDPHLTPPPASNRARRVLLTGLWGLGSQAVTILYQVATVPLFLKFWGQTLYGDWLTVASLVAYLSLATLGLQTYVINLLTQRYVQGRWPELEREVASATLMYLLATGLSLVLLGGICLLVPLDHLFMGLPPTGRADELVTLLLGLRIVVQLFTTLPAGFYRVQGFADYSKLTIFLQQSFVLIAVAAILLVGRGPVELAGAETVAVTLLLVLVLWDTRRRDRRLALSLRGADLAICLSFLGPSLQFFFNQFASQLIFQGIVLLCSYQLGARAVVTFSTTRVIANIVRQLMSFVTTTVYPELTRIDSAGQTERMAFGYRLLLKTVCAVAVLFVPLLFFVGPDLYRVWTRGRAALDLGLLRFMLLDIWLGAPMLASINVLFSTNKMQRVRRITRRNLVFGGVCLGLCALLMPSLGLVAAGALIAGLNLVFFDLSVPIWTQREVGISGNSLISSVYIPYTICTLILAGVAYGMSRMLPGGPTGLLLISISTGLAALPLLWFYFLDGEERIFLLGVLRRRARRSAPRP